MSQPVGILALGRATFDVPYAEAMAARAFAALDAAGIASVGDRRVLFDAPAVDAALADLRSTGFERLLVLQVTFTDAATVVDLARVTRHPLAIWAFPEPRAGGRLRLNSFCGLNLALHALGRADADAAYLYAAPDAPSLPERLRKLVGASPSRPHRQPSTRAATAEDEQRAERCLADLRGSEIALVGSHPAGFDTCRFDDHAIERLAGVKVSRIALGEVFARARAADAATIENHHATVSGYHGINAVDQTELDRSLRLYQALDTLAAERRCSALAVRCWPEMFTEYGAAACGPMGLLNGRGIPAACEADVYGALTQRLLQELAAAPAWLADIVDMDAADDTGVLWHCGSAPLAMREPSAPIEAQIHTNRRMPLLAQFALRAGRITVARITQARNEPALVVGGGDVLPRPMSFTGTSGVVRFDGGTAAALAGLLDHALEHHVALAYGDHRGALAAAGRQLGLPVLELS